jgi:hypothetical protein
VSGCSRGALASPDCAGVRAADWFYEAGDNLAPRCMRCGFDDSKYNVSAAPYRAPAGCPCTTKLLCETNMMGIFDGVNCSARIEATPTRAAHVSLSGGAGALISVGLMRALNMSEMEACVGKLKGRKGECLLGMPPPQKIK